MQARFLLGPAGSGKTHRCLAEIRAALANAPDGPPLVLLAPKQATFQLERQLLGPVTATLSSPALSGYTRLRILSFERLAEFVLDSLRVPQPEQLSEEGRLMVLRALLAKHSDQLELFRASARLPGFALKLNLALRELQHHQLLPQKIETLAAAAQDGSQLPAKLRDLARLLRAYHDWLQANKLQDADGLLDFAAGALKQADATFQLGGLWLDGFAEMTPQELHLLAAIVPRCAGATLAFCLEGEPREDLPWLSTWSVVSQTFRDCHSRLSALDEVNVAVETLPRDFARSRFSAQPALAHLETGWTQAAPFPRSGDSVERRHISEEESAALYRVAATPTLRSPNREGIRLVSCRDAEAEATLAAREILQHVRDRGGRFRDCAVLLRSLDGYHDVLRRTFTRYDIPFFLDRRESVSHHPLAELTRYSLRLTAYDWRHDDWFGALKTGLVSIRETDADRLENAALEFGWEGESWRRPLSLASQPEIAAWAEPLRLALVPPFLALAARVRGEVTGRDLASALRELWSALKIERTLEHWSGTSSATRSSAASSAVHKTVWDQMQRWLESLELAFATYALRVNEWLPILEAGLANLTVGVIPPALDQVLIGTVDRSRNPDLQLVILPGFNETIFPTPPREEGLFTDAERDALEARGARLGPGRLRRIGHERYYGYIACTRARQRLVVSHALYDAEDRELHPSPFVAHLQRMFPALVEEKIGAANHWEQSEHACELVAPLLQNELTPAAARSGALASLLDFSPLDHLRGLISRLPRYPDIERLAPEMAAKLYLATDGAARLLRSSVSRLETFAACPFRFFVEAGLRAGERKQFEVDPRERGTLQHEVLQRFHERIISSGRRWRDLTADAAAELIGQLVDECAAGYREGLFHDDEENRFTTRTLKTALQRFIRAVMGWMRSYQLDPAFVELGFGMPGSPLPAWRIALGEGLELALRGKTDRVDLGPATGGGHWCVVLDYKSSERKLDRMRLHNGLQLQLPAYLAAIMSFARAGRLAGFSDLRPAGMFYANLHGSSPGGGQRDEVLAADEAERAAVYRHFGRFNTDAIEALDAGAFTTPSGQFNFKVTKQGGFNRTQTDPMSAAEFTALLDGVQEKLREFGQRILAGEAAVDPYRQGAETACDRCDYRAVCRIDPRSHRYRALVPTTTTAPAGPRQNGRESVPGKSCGS